MICARCDKPISVDEGYDTVIHHGATGAAPTVYVHKRYCQAPPRRSSLRHRLRR
ncbi:hypothetical protein ACFY9A_29150 [Streptomyces rubradiris]|uniref:hypothetical protein n=1 Tax=Streptomyces rubradiris TaxID=285531 RepID=UPI0036EE5266